MSPASRAHPSYFFARSYIVPDHRAYHNAESERIPMPTLLERISIDPAVCGGKPCIRGTRIWVSLILDLLASGMAEVEMLAEYPQLTHEDILAAIAYGAEASRERMIPLPIEP
jgi:uncharacterized protein (DUF433 family)